MEQMGNASQNISTVKGGRSKQQRALFEVIALWTAKCGLAFRQETSEIDVNIFFDALREYPADRVAEGFRKCLTELMFMPRPVEVIERMPGSCGTFASVPEAAKILREWDEPCSATASYHLTEYEINGTVARICQLVRRRA